MSAYSATDRLLHRLALGIPDCARLSFALEKRLYLRAAGPPPLAGHVFVSGLARAGTTVLTRALAATGAFASLTYRDMPFVLACNAWAAVARRFPAAPPPRERAHGDGIVIDADSPEALDEVFWRVFAGHEYLADDALVPHEPDAATLDDFVRYLRLIMRRHGRARYLAKNNNTLLRLPALLRRFPRSTFLMVVREPLAHAASLLAQHRRFAAPDRFTRAYLTWLGHHEFGATHRPFRLPGARVPDSGSDCLDYWLVQWLNFYSWFEQVAAAAAAPALLIVPYRDLCRRPAVWTALARRLALPAGPPPAFAWRGPARAAPADRALADAAAALYARLAARGRSRLAAGV